MCEGEKREKKIFKLKILHEFSNIVLTMTMIMNALLRPRSTNAIVDEFGGDDGNNDNDNTSDVG